MKIIDEKPWSHVLLEKEGDWILTMLIKHGPIESDISICLNSSEMSLIKKNKANIDLILAKIKENTDNYSDREIKPAVWP